MNKSYIFGGITAVLLASAVLYAAPGAIGMKADIDADNNGVVSKSEALAAADAHFTRMDANNDGSLNQADRAAMVKRHFVELDTDRNGSISEAEFVASHEARAEKRGDHHNMGGKRIGRETPDGMRPMDGRSKGGFGMHMLKAADTNNDQAITKAEFRAAAEARFAKTDTNKDGSISAAEYQARRDGRGRGVLPVKPDAG